MRAHQIMTKYVTTVTPRTTIEDAANIMLRCHLSGVPVVNDEGSLVGIVSESDFLRRTEIGTERKRPAFLQFFASAGKLAADFVHERGRKVEDIMTRDPVTVTEQTPLSELVELMEKRGIKRLPVLSGKVMVGIVTRSNLLQAVASLAREIPDPTADDDHIRDRVTRTIQATDWRPAGFQATVRNGIVHLHGVIFDDHVRQATIVAAKNIAGVKEVHDHLCYVDTYSGFYVESPEDMKAAS
ncbi:CBS domain-containing protein (plasmid) [Bradyrhizobium septentrionale]|uniref:CBS domain-containing protein n=1 Tax=Bradyrhizobium septentrionale TaxID=1404411 RepID=A0A973WAJ1_9BRAD|nr:CBS domain-containing protein [Bradyrhizobium septentrionale]UGY11851.1 CBS domain-containing protein [Bradyrhizobium septentrionale]UGY30061.1 CBS domain-containing protein [Bradyrhizobium septentrionale]